jgi:hypothetical protein
MTPPWDVPRRLTIPQLHALYSETCEDGWHVADPDEVNQVIARMRERKRKEEAGG